MHHRRLGTTRTNFRTSTTMSCRNNDSTSTLTRDISTRISNRTSTTSRNESTSTRIKVLKLLKDQVLEFEIR